MKNLNSIHITKPTFTPPYLLMSAKAMTSLQIGTFCSSVRISMTMT